MQLRTVDNPYAERTTVIYDRAGRVEGETLANGVFRTSSFDGAGRVTILQHFKPPFSVLARQTYKYDKAGNRTEVNDTIAGIVTTFAYDAANRLVNEHAAGTGGYNTTHTYDGAGNRLFEDTGAQRTTFTYDAANQSVTKVAPTGGSPVTTYTYDNAGNLIQERTTAIPNYTLAWDAENRLRQISPPAGPATVYRYDGDNLRRERQVSTIIARYLWDLQNLLLEADGTGALQAVYTLAPRLYGDLISQRRGATSHFAFNDALGSIVALADSAAALSATYRYKAYGQLAASTGSVTNPFRWVGRYGYYFGDLSAYYIRERWYTTVLARWFSEDLLRTRESPNFYSYVEARPTFLIDPFGLQGVAPVPGNEPIQDPQRINSCANLWNKIIQHRPRIQACLNAWRAAVQANGGPNSACANLQIKCVCCGGADTPARYRPSTHTIELCADSRTIGEQLLPQIDTLVCHELVHVLQFLPCGKDDPKKLDCYHLAAREMEAYWCSGACRGGHACLAMAFDSIKQTCKTPFTEAQKQALVQFFNDAVQKNQLCHGIPRPR